jgi:hypothetical protein
MCNWSIVNRYVIGRPLIDVKDLPPGPRGVEVSNDGSMSHPAVGLLFKGLGKLRPPALAHQPEYCHNLLARSSPHSRALSRLEVVL